MVIKSSNMIINRKIKQNGSRNMTVGQAHFESIETADSRSFTGSQCIT